MPRMQIHTVGCHTPRLRLRLPEDAGGEGFPVGPGLPTAHPSVPSTARPHVQRLQRCGNPSAECRAPRLPRLRQAECCSSSTIQSTALRDEY
ncbi:hypothetical protein CALCODRAFT_376746 [Calocera cornea HHB12733]|uniref:Uncharacterized protein n=1 Tax=Calocera cornea HHB12733 TaxID=1353952 RepID=A0A165EE87_9BASI|nr:hypothetical protein CALCODRAFT_376746 [Calocera cornea HHB12733]